MPMMAAVHATSSARQAILLLLLIFAGRDGVSAQSGKNHTLYLLSLLAYPNNNTSLEPSISDGNDIIPGAHLAVSDINNRSDVLTDYRLELLTAADGCNVSWIAVVNLIDYLYYKEGKQIVGIVGPECSDSTKVVASITGRPEIALLNVHLGSAPELADRTLYPFSYGIRPPTSADVDAVIALFKYNKWTRAAVLYNSEMLVDYNSFLLFQEKIKGTANLTYTSSASPTKLPLEQLRRSYVRVIVSFLRDETLKRVLCLAYFKNMAYPRYQWILFEPYDSSNVSFWYEGNQYECSSEQMIKTLSQIIIQTDNYYDDTSFISYIDEETIIDACQYDYLCYVLFDAVWAIALALNNSIEPLRASGLSLSNYVHGELDYTQIVKEQMDMLSFNGQWGAVQFHSSTGFSFKNIISTFYCYDDTYSIIGTYSFPNGILDIDSGSDFVSTNFDEKLVLISTPLAVVIIIVEVVAAVLVIMVHILNTVYSHRKTIRLSSRWLNHFAYIGCYIILIGTLFYTIMETFNINQQAKDVLCNAFPWTLITGLTLVFGTVLAKAWRLYHIYHSSLKHKKAFKIVIQDRSLIIMIVILVSLSAVLCLAWTLYDPLVRKSSTTLAPEGDDLIIFLKESCSCTYEVEWVVAGMVYEGILIISTVILAFLSKNISIKELQSTSTILMAYLLTLTTLVGGTIYYITKTIGAETDVPYAILCFSLMIIVYLCIMLLFLPPVLPVMKEWPFVKKWPGLKGLPVIKNLPFIGIHSIEEVDICCF
ncbi:hypothetical protein EMCRGX_G025897 [Ephydatia muelleri]|eukprot:Em0021g628a